MAGESLVKRRGRRQKKAMTWAIAIHGGAGTIRRDMPPERVDEIRAALGEALEVGREMLARGARALDATEAVVRFFEDDPKFNAGRGAVLAADGTHELDAAIMDGATLRCGAVGAARTPRHAISLARAVMEETHHILLVEEGADALARELGLEQVANDFFTTERRKAQWERFRSEHPGALSRSEDDTEGKGTVGAVALDVHGDLVAATSTGGLTNKRRGRVGDTGVIGAGTYANNATCAVSCTGTGEEFMRHLSAHAVHARMSLAGESLEEAARAVVFETMSPGDGGVIAVSHRGEVAMPFSSEGMYRGAATDGGRFEVHIWGDGE
jgi:beta-aspartyl-peptidase (threonine type)